MKRRSPTNIRPWENLVLRAEYKRDNGHDELASLFPISHRSRFVQFSPSGDRIYISLNHQFSQACHHITGGLNGARRHDIVPNLICLSNIVHRWVEQFQADGIVLCIHAKTVKGEWDWNVMNEIMHPFSIRGWLETKEPVFEFIKPHWESVLKHE